MFMHGWLPVVIGYAIKYTCELIIRLLSAYIRLYLYCQAEKGNVGDLMIQDTRYKMVLLPFHVYNYTHIRHYAHIDIHNS